LEIFTREEEEEEEEDVSDILCKQHPLHYLSFDKIMN
jgi:hypothetical protein